MKYFLLLLISFSCCKPINQNKDQETEISKLENLRFPEIESIESIDTINSIVLKILKNDVLILNAQPIEPFDLCNELKSAFIDKKKIIIQNEHQTNYKFYTRTHKQLQDCHNRTINEISMAHFNRSIEELDSLAKVKLLEEYPLVIVETQPNSL